VTADVENAIVRLVRETPFTESDVRDVLAARTLEEVQELAAMYAAAGRPADRTTWQTFVVVLGDVVEGAEAIAPFVGIAQQLAAL
jgi:hypothetical protein